MAAQSQGFGTASGVGRGWPGRAKGEWQHRRFSGSGGDGLQPARKAERPKRPGAVVMVMAWVEAEAAGWPWWRQTQAKLKNCRGDKRLPGGQSRLCSLARGCTMMVGLVTVGCLLPRRAVGFSQVWRRWLFGLAVSLRPTVRAADTATPWARRGGGSSEGALPAVVVGRRRRAADAIVGHKEAEVKALLKVKVRAETVERCGFEAAKRQAKPSQAG